MTQPTDRPSDWGYAGNPSGEYLYWLEPNGNRHEATDAELTDWKLRMVEIKRVASSRRAARSRPIEDWENEGGLVSGE